MTLPKGRKSTGDVSLPYREARKHLEWYCQTYRDTILKPAEAIKELKNASYIKGTHFPSSNRGVGKWLEVIYAGMESLDYVKMNAWYSPMYTQNDKYFKSEDSPYLFTTEDKTYLYLLNRLLEQFLWIPMSTTSRMTNHEAIWCCRLINSNPLLRGRDVDVYLWAKAFAIAESRYGYESEEIKTLNDYMIKAPFTSLGNQQNYINYIRNNMMKPNPSIFGMFVLDPNDWTYDIGLEWFLDFPLVYGANVGTYEWLTPHRRLLHWLHQRLEDMLHSDQWITHYKEFKHQYNESDLGKVQADTNEIGTYLEEKIFHGLEKDKFVMTDNTSRFIKDEKYLAYDLSLLDRWYPLMITIYELDKAGGVIKEGMSLTMLPTITKLADIVVAPETYPFKYPIRKI